MLPVGRGFSGSGSARLLRQIASGTKARIYIVCTEYLTYWVEVMLCIERNTSRLFSAQLYGTWNVLGTKVGDIYAQSQPWMLKGKQR